MTTQKPVLSMIVAKAANHTIGKDNTLPWHLPADLKYFKKITMGKPMVMGRKTWESIGKPLPGRTSIVVSSNPKPESVPVEVHWVQTIEEALAAAAATGAEELFVIGGAQLFMATAGLVQRQYLTRIHQDIPGDVFLPDLPGSWQLVQETEGLIDEANQLPHSFQIWERA